MVHVSNALGTVNPVREMIELAHARGVPVLVDGAQAVPHVAVDVRELDCDFYVFSGHKVYGPTGIGALYGKREHLLEMVPYQGGGDMILSVTFEDDDLYTEPPHRFEAGTPNIEGAIGLAAALDYLDDSRSRRRRCPRGRASRRRHRGGPRGPGRAAHRRGQAQRVGAVSLSWTGSTRTTSAPSSTREGVAIRAGHHCAQPVMAALSACRQPCGPPSRSTTRWTRSSASSTGSQGQGGLRLMSDMRELYQEIILDHNKKPRNCYVMDCATRSRPTATTRSAATSSRSTCGSKTASSRRSASRAHGCAICTASTSLMTESVKGKSVDEVRELFEGFHDMLTGVAEEQGLELGKLQVFEGVREYPVRVKCATLAWHTLNAAMDGEDEPVTTE